MKGKFVCTGISLAILVAALLAGSGCGYSNNNSVTGNGLPQTQSRVYVVNSEASTVSAFNIDPSNGSLTPTGNPVATGTLPNYAAATPDGKFLYVANTAVTSNSVSAYTIDRTTGALTPTNPPTVRIASDELPLGIVVNSTSTRVYTANALSISAFSIDPNTGNLHELTGSPVPAEFGDQPQDLRISPNGQFLFVTNGINGVVATYTFDQNGLPQQVSTLRIGGFPIGLTVDPSGKFLYVSNLDSDNVASFAITPGTGALVPINTASVQRGCAPQEITADAESKFLYVSCTGIGINTIDVFRIDPTTGAVTSAGQDFSTGDNNIPSGLAFDPSGRFLFSALSSSNQISTQVVGADGRLTSSGTPANTAKRPVGIVVVPGH